ncbi:MAG TPA: protein kinase, partial [Candidatus Krumholzibacteria bacterium]|nr:protein kinase [Candidatus Krumholzibacteria bacterium]
SKLGRDVALKVLPEGFASDAERLARFQREARLLASLNHPHIATIHGIEGEGAQRVLVLELVEGDDLATRLASGPIPVKEALPIARQVADAIESAHDQGIVHRDLKPANVVVTPGGVVKVLDFGLAKAIETDASNSNLSHSPTLLGSSPTMAGVILGTAAYMSPEQARGKRVDRRADIFAFGCLFFEMLTGRQAFSGETVSDTLAAVLRAEPEWSLLPQDTPRAIVKLLKRCLEKDPRQRLRDIGEARIVIEAVERGVEIDEPGNAAASAAAPAASRRAWLPWSIAALAVMAAITSIVISERGVAPTTNAQPLTQLSLTLPPNSSLALRGQNPAPPAISPDGRRVVFGISSGGSATLYVRSLDQDEAVELPGTDGAAYPFWSPDNQKVAFFAGGKLKRVDASGGPVTSVCDAALGKGGTWADDGTIYFAPNYASGIFKVASSGGTATAVTVADSSRGEVSHRFPRMLPDQKHFLYLARAVSVRSGSTSDVGIKLKVASTDGKDVREIMPTESNAAYSNGRLLFTRNGFLVAQVFNPSTFQLSGEPVPLATHMRAITGASWSLFDVSSSGNLIYQAGTAVEGNQLTWVDMKGQKIGPLGDTAQHDDPVRISPDGSQVTLSIFDPRVGTPDVWIYDVKRNLRTRFTTDPAADNNPVWSPDGSRIVFSSTRRGHVELYAKSLGGSKPEELFYAGHGDNFAAGWSPDGKYVISAQLISGGGWTIQAIPAGSGEPFKILNVATGFGCCFSPSGRWLAFDSNDSGARDTYVVPFHGSGRKWQVSSSGGFAPRWVGKHIYYYNERSMMRTEVSEQDSTITVGNEETLFNVSDLQDFDVTRDEQKLLLLQTLDEGNKAPLTVVLNWTQKLPATK